MAIRCSRRLGFCSGASSVLMRGLCTGEHGDKALQICVVGSGPAGFYTAEKLLKRFEESKVDIVERLPTPFGLVRSGVAPDHPETKVVVNQFSRVASNERCGFFGNICLGKDVSLEELRKNYHIVVLAYGAESDNKLGIPGESLHGVHSAREFVWWYNGHPDGKDLPIDLKKTETAVILGQGNVALDAARILLRPVDELASTDIAEHALNVLQDSQIRRVYVVGRRGPVQAACTAKELREILGIRGVEVFIPETDLQTTASDLAEMKTSRSHKRVYELFCKGAAQKPSGGEKQLHFVFFRAPRALLASEDGRCVTGVRLEKTKLEERSGDGQQQSVGTNEFEELECGLVLKSIGYKSLPVPGLPFDQKKGIVPNVLGRVLNNNETYKHGLYVAGWLKRGPTGIIGTNLNCAEEVVTSIEEDVKSGRVTADSNVLGSVGLQSILKDRNKKFISFEDWEKLNREEINKGALKGKPREKFVSTEDALAAAQSNFSKNLFLEDSSSAT